MTDAVDRLAVAERAARAGSEVAAEGFRSGIDVERKSGKTDVVTEADRAAQRRVIEVIREEFPDDAIVGEEEDELKAVPDEGDAWIIDPIDGTNNYVRDIPVWTTSVAAVRDGDPVSVSDRTDPEEFAVAPTIWWDFDRRDEYAAVCEGIVERFGDMRRFGCAQVTLGMVAAGSLDGTVTNVVPNPWDTVAGVYMVRQAGGVVTDLDGNPWRHDSEGLVASNGEAHDELLAVVRDVA